MVSGAAAAEADHSRKLSRRPTASDALEQSRHDLDSQDPHRSTGFLTSLACTHLITVISVGNWVTFRELGYMYLLQSR